MPSVKSTHWQTIIIMILIPNKWIMSGIKWISQIWGRIILFYNSAIFIWCETPGTSEIVFHSCSTYCWIFFISINVEFNFTLSPPVPLQSWKSQISTYIMATSFYIIKNNIIFSNFSDCLPSPLSMKIRSVFWKRIIQAVINLIKKGRYWIFMLILNSNASMLWNGIAK